MLAVIGLHASLLAQVPAATMARHVRAVPIRVARVVGAPTVDAVGSFTAPRASRGADIVGIVQDHLGVLVPNAGTVIVRELLGGTVVGRTEVNGLAQFSVTGVPPGLYSAELVTETGAVIANTPAFRTAIGEVIQISQTIPATPATAFSRLASGATSLALTTAASSGVLAIAPGAPTTPRQ
jgi:hypothetical protein